MLKQRVGIWLLIIALAWSIKGIVYLCTIPTTNIYVNYNLEKNPELSQIRDITAFHTNLNINIKGKDPDIIIDTANDNIEGYTKTEDAYISPLVLYAGDIVLFENNGFIIDKRTEGEDETNNIASKDLKDILLAIENNKSWKDIGIPESVFTGKVKLAIPQKDSDLYLLVKDLFMVNLKSTYGEKTKEIVDNILKKCNQVENIGNYIKDMNNADEIAEIVPIIAPEAYLPSIIPYSNERIRNKKSTFVVPVYFTKTVAIKYNWYEKNNLNMEQKESINKVFSTKKMLTKVGIRSQYKQIDLSKLSTHCKEELIIKN